MKREGVIFVCLSLILIISLGVISAGDLPFEVKNASLILNDDGGTMILNIKNEIFFRETPLGFEDIPNYYTYLNGVFFYSNPGYVGLYDFVKESSISSQTMSSLSETVKTPLLNSLKVGENELIIATRDLTIDENGNFIPTRVINQYGINEEFYQRLSNGDFVLCSHYEEGTQIIDNNNCVFDNGGIGDEFNLGPPVGIVVKFELTQEQLDLGFSDTNNFSFPTLIIGIPQFYVEFGGELVDGRKIFVREEGAKSNEVYSVYFNNNFVKQIKTNSLGRFIDVFELQSDWINYEQTNKIILKDSQGHSFEKLISSYYPFNDPSQENNEWKGIIFLNDTAGYYGDKISVYGAGFSPNKEYILRIHYEGIPGGHIKVITNKLGEFQEDNFEINPPVLTDVLLFVKNLFSGKPDEPSGVDIESAIKELDSVSIVVELEDGGLGTSFSLCDNAPNFTRINYCAE